MGPPRRSGNLAVSEWWQLALTHSPATKFLSTADQMTSPSQADPTCCIGLYYSSTLWGLKAGHPHSTIWKWWPPCWLWQYWKMTAIWNKGKPIELWPFIMLSRNTFNPSLPPILSGCLSLVSFKSWQYYESTNTTARPRHVEGSFLSPSLDN